MSAKRMSAKSGSQFPILVALWNNQSPTGIANKDRQQ
jgi:hypothetical protein